VQVQDIMIVLKAVEIMGDGREWGWESNEKG
jgi:hypothetical protein